MTPGGNRFRHRPVRRHASAGGFSAVELMVVLAVLGMLLAVLLPAIQAVRESGRQSECRSHLHQFGVALHAFEGVHRRLPSKAGPSVKKGETEIHYPYSAHFMLLPHFELRTIFELIDFSGGTPRLSVKFHEVVDEPIPVFLCPSDYVGRGTNYRLSMGPLGHHVMPRSKGDHPQRGAFATVGGTALAEIRDGLSQTIALSERYRSDHDTSSFSPQDYWYTGSIALGSLPSSEGMIAEAQSLQPPPAVYYPWTGHQWHKGSFASTCFNQLLEPNSPVLDCSMDSVPDMESVRSSYQTLAGTAVGMHLARSYHPGGVHVLMVDGAVVFTSDQIDLTTWRSLGTISDAAP